MKISDDPLDYTLPENPDVTMERLDGIGERQRGGGTYGGYVRRYLQELNLEKGVEPTFDQRLAIEFRARMGVLERYPYPVDAVPLESLREWFNVASKRLSAVTQRDRRRREIKQRFRPTQEDIRRWNKITTIKHDDDVTWVYLNIDNKECYPKHAPSRGAWTMLLQARENKQWFYDKHYRPVAERQSKLRQAEEVYEYRPSRQERLDCEELREMLNEAREAIGLQPIA